VFDHVDGDAGAAHRQRRGQAGRSTADDERRLGASVGGDLAGLNRRP
jgi:hypothetical protein